MAQATLTVKMDQEVRDRFVAVCERLGMSASAAVNLLARQMVLDEALPFAPTFEIPTPTHEDTLALNAITSTVQRIARCYPDIRRVTLFGSYARGEADETSDVDLRVEYDPGSSFSIIDLAGFAEETKDALGRPVDVVSKRMLEPTFAEEIKRDGLVIYER